MNEELKEQKKSKEAFLKQQKEQHELMENQKESLINKIKDNESFITAKFYPYIVQGTFGYHNVFKHRPEEIGKKGKPIKIFNHMNYVKKIEILGELKNIVIIYQKIMKNLL